MDLKNQTQKRPIKFRGRCAFSGTWRYGFYYVSKGNHIIRDENDKESIVLEKTLGQFTGLHDKNGKEIYEGDMVDVLSAGSHLPNGIIKFGQGAAKFFIGNESNSICWNLSGGGHNYTQENLEIIGNIFDDPELVKL